MESRGYDGEINVIMPKINHSVKFNVFAVIYVVITTAIAIFSRKAGIWWILSKQKTFHINMMKAILLFRIWALALKKGKITTILGAKRSRQINIVSEYERNFKAAFGDSKIYG
mgnify:CR=1 FL=1